MKRITIFLLVTIIGIASFHLSSINVLAVDDSTYYGDGTSAGWDDIKEYINELYANLPYISVDTDNGKQVFYFNVEIFIDLGLYVYGGPESIAEIGSVNDFKETQTGYFIQEKEDSTIKGEYRYIGLSTTGAPVSNSRFPPDHARLDFDEMAPMKYSDLTDARKKKYNIYGVNNDAYAAIADIIDSSQSPAFAFLNEGISDVPLGEQLNIMGYMQDGEPLISLFEYGIIYSWDINGGMIRMFFKQVETDLFYCYATFVGPVSLEFTKKIPSLLLDISMPEGKKYYLKPDQEYIDVPICIAGGIVDNYASLSDFGKKYTFLRTDITDKKLVLCKQERKIINEIEEEDTYSFIGETLYLRLYRSQFTRKLDAVSLVGNIYVYFGNLVITTTVKDVLTIVVEEATPAPNVLPTATPIATPSPDATASVKPALPQTTPGPVSVNRKW